MLSKRDSQLVQRVFDRVIDNGRVLRTFFQMLRSGLFDRKSLSYGLQRAINRWLNKAYLLKESFGQLWDCQSPLEARRFFHQWKEALRWQRLEPFERFARMVSAHWDVIEAYCHEENRVPLGFVEGLNNKIRAIQRQAYGFRDEEYFRLKILTCTLPRL